jgi:Fanconi anemia group D2 protein
LVSSAALTEKLLEVMPVCPPPLQRELIAFLPELILEEDHNTVVAALQDLVDEASLISGQALSNFCFPSATHLWVQW